MSGTGAVNFTITAQDEVSKKLDTINKRIAGMTKGVDRTQKAFSGLALQDLSNLSKRIDNAASGALKMSEGLLKAVEPLAVITSAASLAGVVRLADAWANTGSQLLFTSQNLGISAQKLQVWQNAGQLAGVSIDNMTSGLQSLGQNMWNAVGGRDPAFMSAMQQLHINFRAGAIGMKDYSTLLPQIADKIKSIHTPFGQAAVATALFGSAGQAMLPFLRQGAASMTAYLNAGAANGTMSQDQINKANQLRQSFTGLNQVLTGNGGLVNQIEAGLDPVLQPTIAWMQQWVLANQSWINLDIAKSVHNLGVEIKSIDWTGVNSFMNLLTGKSVASNVLNGITGFEAHPVASIDSGAQSLMKWTMNEFGFGGVGKAPILRQIDGLAPTSARGVRDNNPLNLTYDPGQRGVVARDGRFGVFPDMATGVSANLNQLLLDQSRGANTLSKLIPTWAPSSDGNNDPAYIESVSSLTGIDPNAPLNLSDPMTAFKVMNAMANTEVGGSIPAGALVAGINQRLGTALVAPSGPPANIGSGNDVMAGIGAHQGGSDAMQLDVHFHNAPDGMRTSLKGGNAAVKPGTVKVERAMLAAW